MRTLNEKELLQISAGSCYDGIEVIAISAFSPGIFFGAMQAITAGPTYALSHFGIAALGGGLVSAAIVGSVCFFHWLHGS
jgi:hypothetical protein